jgi:hypothetical protein
MRSGTCGGGEQEAVALQESFGELEGWQSDYSSTTGLQPSGLKPSDDTRRRTPTASALLVRDSRESMRSGTCGGGEQEAVALQESFGELEGWQSDYSQMSKSVSGRNSADGPRWMAFFFLVPAYMFLVPFVVYAMRSGTCGGGEQEAVALQESFGELEGWQSDYSQSPGETAQMDQDEWLFFSWFRRTCSWFRS